MSPVVTQYICDGCGDDVKGGDGYWITCDSFGSADRFYAHLIVHNHACAARYFARADEDARARKDAA